MDVVTYIKMFLTVIGIFGVFGNGLVCVVIVKVPAMRTLTNAFIFNQAVIDLLGSFLMILHGNIMTPSPLHPNAAIAAIQCYVWFSSIILWILFVASTFNLVMLTFERYVAIVFPFKYLAYSGKKQATITLVVVWALAAAYKSSNVIYFQIKDRSCGMNNTLYLTFGILTFLIEYLIPLIVMTFCYIHIILKLKKASSTVHAEPTNVQQGEHSMSRSMLRARRNTLKTLFIVFVSYIICWSPNEILFFLHNLGFQVNVEDGTFYFASMIFVQVNSCINPIIYSFKYKQFQRSLGVLLKPCFPRLASKLTETTATATSAAQTNPSQPNVNRESSLTIQAA